MSSDCLVKRAGLLALMIALLGLFQMLKTHLEIVILGAGFNDAVMLQSVVEAIPAIQLAVVAICLIYIYKMK